MQWPDDAAFEADLRSALALNADERALLGSLALATSWQRAATPWGKRMGWLSLTLVLAAAAAWVLVGPLVATLLEPIARLGVGAMLLRFALTVAWAAGESVLTLAANPALSLSLPILAVIGLALLAWPRWAPKPIPTYV
jgi:hypothetical protein